MVREMEELTERWERNGERWLVGSNASLRDAELQPLPSSFVIALAKP